MDEFSMWSYLWSHQLLRSFVVSVAFSFFFFLNQIQKICLWPIVSRKEIKETKMEKLWKLWHFKILSHQFPLIYTMKEKRPVNKIKQGLCTSCSLVFTWNLLLYLTSSRPSTLSDSHVVLTKKQGISFNISQIGRGGFTNTSINKKNKNPILEHPTNWIQMTKHQNTNSTVNATLVMITLNTLSPMCLYKSWKSEVHSRSVNVSVTLAGSN